MVVDGKADQTDVEALKHAMQRLDATVTAKARGSSATAARDAEAMGALQVAFRDMSASMEGSIRKLQQVCSGGVSCCSCARSGVASTRSREVNSWMNFFCSSGRSSSTILIKSFC